MDLLTRYGIMASQFNIKTGYASFDGSGDYFSLVNSTDWDFGSGDFCVEANINLASVPTTAGNHSVIAAKDNVTSRAWIFLTDGDNAGKLAFTIRSGGTPYTVIAPSTFPANVNKKIKASRNGGTLSLYVDDVSVSSVSVAGVTVNSVSVLQTIGVLFNTSIPVGYLIGNIYGMRITKGRSRSVENVPAVFGVDGSDVVFCTNFGTALSSGTFTDDTGKTVTAYGNATITVNP